MSDLIERIKSGVVHGNELEKALRSVSDSYFDFCLCVISDCSECNELTLPVIDFIKNNPDAQTDDVLTFIESIDPRPRQEIEISDD